MNLSRAFSLPSNILLKPIALLFSLAVTLIVFAPSVGAASVTSTMPATGVTSVAPGETFKLTINTDNDPDIAALEVDHSIASLPEFTLAADATDPYDGDAAAYNAAGVSVVYNQTSGQWVIDFGPTVTQAIIDNGGVTFYLVLRDGAGDILWGSMSPTTPQNTFAFTVTRAAAADPVTEDDDEAVIPGVPNTATPEATSLNLIAVAIAATLAISVATVLTAKKYLK